MARGGRDPNFEPVIGIDLGTSFCCLAICQGYNDVEIIVADEGKRTTPSYVGFSDSECMVGAAARRYAGMSPSNCIFEVKRLMGRSFLEKSVQDDARMWPFQVVPGPNGEALVRVPSVPGRDFRPEDISAELLKKMKGLAESYAGRSIRKAVITVPAYFSDLQRQATKAAGSLAGLEVMRLMSEPTAAAVAYGSRRLMGTNCRGKRILVFDLGGGTFDVSIITVTCDEGLDDDANFKVNAVAGNSHLGGADFDNNVVAFFRNEYARLTRQPLPTDPKTMSKLREAAVEAKHALSFSHFTPIDIEMPGNRELCTTLSRATFEELNRPLFAQCIDVVEEALRGARISKHEISDVVLIGGSSRIPMVQEMLRTYFGKPPLQNMELDEAVAYGAAVQAGMLVSNRCVEVSEVTPLSIGVQLNLQQMGVIIPKNTPLPACGSDEFAAAIDYQTSLSFQIYEGERALCSANRFLGEFEMTGFRPAPADGRPVVKLILQVDPDGLLHARAEPTRFDFGADAVGAEIRGTLHTGDIHRVIADAQASQQTDNEIRAAFQSRLDLRVLTLHLRQNISRMSWLKRRLLGNRVKNTLAWLSEEVRVSPRAEYERRKRKLARFGRLPPTPPPPPPPQAAMIRAQPPFPSPLDDDKVRMTCSAGGFSFRW
ncbi:hypothetical protein CBR_g52103 [Chara braunii]|uniref:Uncharacterized protein n=1 Tax=Chara braunii TaxID=69332 RepID=A0A388M9G9_CHABU|nr:hypothetical protein CBR_g52103 [Chara braunii]|eukprot:GBG91221.1 hypothetical protein CBR_g52103 [Chara braunii]